MRHFLLLFLFFLPLCADRYEIRGDSPHLDTNLTVFLDRWRADTTAPIREGRYNNVRLCAECNETKTVALTFDDSPDENNTFAVLDILKRYDVRASFFMIGAPMNDINATAVKRAFSEGHLILNHSYTHPRLTDCNATRLLEEMQLSGERIRSLIGKTPQLFRPPYGSINPDVVDAINAQKLTTVLWSLDSLDWALHDPQAITDNVVKNVRPGDIILMHSSRANGATAVALPSIIERLDRMGYRFDTLDRLLGTNAYGDN